MTYHGASYPLQIFVSFHGYWKSQMEGSNWLPNFW